jgi:hypothetical protein
MTLIFVLSLTKIKIIEHLAENFTRPGHQSLTNAYPNIPPLTINGKTANTTQEKLKAFADTLQHILNTNPDVDHSFTVNDEQVVNYFIKQLLADE